MKYQVGDKASFTKTITETDVYLFAGITGDLNPAHVNETWAKNTRFGGRIAHGMLSGGLISAVLGMQLPGPGTIYMGQTLKFTAPVHIGDTVTAQAEVVEIIDGKRLRLHTTATTQEGTLVVDGEALVMPPRE
ncbi:MAG: MaoC domain protein dehydratase [Symbiobacteriaceae bacterium]|jgi:3-hydroxybutyryl-CoA dehydratase|nr:MaoC domain protein dehydratase [Symbiobacteriaceae bacterium]